MCSSDDRSSAGSPASASSASAAGRAPGPTPGQRASIAVVMATMAVAGLLGLRWGLPSEERTRLLLPADRGRAIEQVIAQATTDTAEKLRTALVMPLAAGGPFDAGRTLAEDPVAHARVVRRFLTFSCDWDENTIVRALAFMRPGQLDFNPRTFQYGGLAIYPVGALIRLAMTLGLLPTRMDMPTFLADPEHPARLYLVGRLWMLVLTIVGLWAVWWAATQAHGPEIGLLSGILFALATPVNAWLVLLKPHLPAVGFVALSYGFASRALILGRPGQLVPAALASACAASLSPPAGLSILLPLAATIVLGGGVRVVARRGALAVAAAAALFCLFNPYYVLDLAGVRLEAHILRGLYPVRPSLASLVSIFWHQVANAVPLPLLVLAGVGVFAGQPVPRWFTGLVPAVFLASAVSTFGGRTDPSMVRFLLPALPFLAIWTAQGFRAVERRSRGLALATLAVGGLWTAGLDGFYHLDRLVASRGVPTEVRAARWFLDNVPVGAEVGLVREPNPRLVPPIQFGRYAVRKAMVAPRSGQWVVTTEPLPHLGGLDLAARFVEESGPVRLQPLSGAPSTAADPDLSEHAVTVMGVPLGLPLQLHQMPAYIFRKR
ncbi:MAG: hypothetical protein HY815_33380 [Candidatus Riflebacteria bacterium]|nr:hypothetical protein [Candidatus Riflebacteria bacterium]